MYLKGIEWLKGYVNCTVEGKHIEVFINIASSKKLNIWDFKIHNNQKASFSIGVDDYFNLKPLIKKTYSKLYINKKIGFPFLLNKSIKRKGILFGGISFFIIIYLMTSMIWTINIEGSDKISDEEIINALEQIGIHEKMFKYQLPSNDKIQSELIYRIDNLAWIGVKLEGTQLNLTILEKVKPDIVEKTAPSNIVSAKDAIIYKITAEKGKAIVKVNDRVKKGDILISGVIGNEENFEEVSAKGEVLGVVWYTSEITIPLKQSWKEYTGEVTERRYITFSSANRMLKYKGYKKIEYENYVTDYNWIRITWKDYKLPIVIITEKNLEYEEKERVITKEEAKKLALEQTKDDLFSKIEPESEIISEKILHETIENDKLSLKILYEVLEDISTTQLIIQGE